MDFFLVKQLGFVKKNLTDPESWQLGSTESQHCVWASRRSVVARRPEKTVDDGETDGGEKNPQFLVIFHGSRRWYLRECIFQDLKS